MPAYTYTAIDKKKRQKKGTITANTIDDAKRILASQGKMVIEINEPSILSKLTPPKKITPKDISIFCQQMASMLRAGITIVDALNMVAGSTANERLKAAIENCSTEVSKGNTLSSAMETYKDIFPFLLIKMVDAGERSGAIDETFDRMAIQFEKSHKTKETIKKALNYPKLLLGICFAAVMLVSVVVLPNFVGIFEEMGTDLPLPTKFLMGMSDFILAYWWVILIIGVIAILGWKYFSRTEKGQNIIARVKLKIPAFRNLEQKSATATMARLLCTLLGSGMYMAESLEIVEGTMDNIVFREAVKSIRTDVMNGETLSEAIDSTDLFPPLFYNLVSIGEQTGDISKFLEKAADYFEEEVDLATQQLSGMIQPAMIMIMGGMVGLLVYAIYGPMMGIYDGLE